MTTKVHIADGEREWVVEVAGDAVTIEGVDGSFKVSTDAEGRVRVDRTGADWAGAAAIAEATAWVSLEGTVFAWRLGARPAAPRTSSRGYEILTPPMSATVVRIPVAPGDRVEAGDTLIVLEAMKMELPIRAPRAATVRAIHCREGDLVQPEQVLIDLGD